MIQDLSRNTTLSFPQAFGENDERGLNGSVFLARHPRPQDRGRNPPLAAIQLDLSRLHCHYIGICSEPTTQSFGEQDIEIGSDLCFLDRGYTTAGGRFESGWYRAHLEGRMGWRQSTILEEHAQGSGADLRLLASPPLPPRHGSS